MTGQLHKRSRSPARPSILTTPTSTTRPRPTEPPERLTLLGHFAEELGLHGSVEELSPSESDDELVVRLLEVPYTLERLLVYGFLICLDTFLTVFTFLPLLVLRAVVLALLSPLRRGFHRAQLFDLLRGSLVAITVAVLLHVPLSRLYHLVRGQAFIKLYVIVNLLEIVDKLFCSLGSDVMDILYSATRSSPHAVHRILVRFFLALLYTIAHSVLYFTRLITLNVAINSTNNALLTIIVSNNFVELKSSVFKRFAEQNLLQISCSDVVERFELFVFLALTAVQPSVGWERFRESACYIAAAEVAVDWVKHSFITKFNMLHPSVYENFREILSSDVLRKTPKRSAASTSTGAVARRVGLSTLPLACVVLRMLWVNAPIRGSFVEVSLAFGCLLALKSLLSMCITAYACLHLERCEATEPLLGGRDSSPRLNPTRTPTEQRQHLAHLQTLQQIQRYTLFKSRVPT